ncbi:hypothetical protein RHSIM_Rhsim06G0016300 [Rhododendron simsii]|uniref:Uncharacterized protein n=1 Tax=Rhododendron simsii TaxID=118357 RepID=A0A834GUB5_RHOSS|nr:hypothetical protein RHSIM_Rhsim06G0016300 [Rhododendron simsii]
MPIHGQTPLLLATVRSARRNCEAQCFDFQTGSKDRLLEPFLDLADSTSTLYLDHSFDRLLKSRACDSDQNDMIERAMKMDLCSSKPVRDLPESVPQCITPSFGPCHLISLPKFVWIDFFFLGGPFGGIALHADKPLPTLHCVGVTPERVEVPRSLVDEEMQEKLRAMPKESQPSTPSGPDPKWRYMWRVGPRPSNTRFQELNAEPVIPEGFPEWKETMDSWGYKMISAIEAVAQMAAIGFGLPKDAFTSLMKQWVPELWHYAPLVPIVLVGTKMGNYAFILLEFTASGNICDGWCVSCFLMKFPKADLREDKQFQMDYPGACAISTAQGEVL